MASATVTEPLIARDGWPTESPHFTEERITFALGVGWRYLPVRPGDIGGDLDFVAAMRGWERFIENHFQAHIGRARMFLERKDEGMYLVAATPPGAKTAAQRAQAQRLLTTRYGEAGGGGARCEVKHPAFFDAMEDGDEEVAYYLFKDDLSRARCVGGSWGQCVENLNKRPIRFLEGSVELVAQQPPKTQTQKMGSADGDDMDIDVSN
ncbi:hypothetical protein KEM56_003399 [Ascosphaera pollenicola]|nr:hypothetical protein KEM56_003399 [Ascosphaera pollenicola]